MAKISRRQMVQGMVAAGAAAAAPSIAMRAGRAAGASADPKFLIVLAASGGGSLIDSVMAIRRSESDNADILNTFADSEVQSIDSSPFRAVDIARPTVGPIPIGFTSTNQSGFVRKNKDDMMVTTWTRTSVNHAVGQRRAVTGNEAWAGRTLQEIVAYHYGEGFPLPNVHLATDNSVSERGTDRTLPSFAFGETVADPALWPLALDGVRGLSRPMNRTLVERARRLRNDRLEPSSTFNRVFGQSSRLVHWRQLRGAPQQAIEGNDLIDKLLLFPDSPQFPVRDFGLRASEDARRLVDTFPDILTDPLDAQAALAFLLIKNRVSVTVTRGPSFDVALREGAELDLGALTGGGGNYGDQVIEPDSMLNTPIAFDFSHQAHRATQALMWNRIFRVAGGLIDLLKGEEYANGESLWDRTMLYIASDFGREKRKPAGAEEWGTSHDLNNGVITLSPLVNGNTILGGVDPNTGLTYGFDPQTGAPDPGRNMNEPQIFAGLLQALGIDTSEASLPNVPAMRKS